MSTAEIKLELFRKIDNLEDAELKGIYQMFLTLLSASEKYTLTISERSAIEEAITYSNNGETFSHQSVMNEAKSKYSKLKFKRDK